MKFPMRPLNPVRFPQALAGICLLTFAPAGFAGTVDFKNDVQSVLESRCIECHGGKKQKASLRFDSRAAILKGGDSGDPMIVPGNTDAGTLLKRITSTDDDEKMPPKGERLTGQQIAIFKQWIAEGASIPDEYGTVTARHWAYIKPVRPAVPDVSAQFSVLSAQLKKASDHSVTTENWSRNPIDAFILKKLADEKLVPSPEAPPEAIIRRMALDLTGLPPTPDEVNDFSKSAILNLQSAIENLADRLLASPAYGERWARPWLDLARYADTQGYEKDSRRSVWPYRDWVIGALNADMPFDQFTVEQIAGDLLPSPTQAQRVATGFHRNTLTNAEDGTDDEEFRYYAVVDRVNTTMQGWMGTTFNCAQCHDHKYDPFTTQEYYQFMAFLNSTADSDKDDDWPTMRVWQPGQQEHIETLRVAIRAAQKNFDEAAKGEFSQSQGVWEQDAATKPADPKNPLPDDVRKILAIAADQRDDKQRARLAEFYKTIAPELKPQRDALATAQEAEKKFNDSIPITSVLEELPKPRETKRHIRGGYLSLGETVQPATPAALHPFPKDQPVSRLGLARWLVDENNPLTARVIVNRFWEQFFGHGIVESVEEFGKQGDAPAHPELLDWLAVEFMHPTVFKAAKPWSMKSLHRLIVTSEAYRQSSHVSSALAQRDPFNKLLARGPRVRLEAETVRDQALAVSGLLSRKMGGPPVMPPQPEGVWSVVYSGDKWATSEGEDKYRRGIYTFWRRTSPYPMMVSFDAPSREFCVLRRSRSDTPLQALDLLNDPVFVECAQALARRIAAAPGDTAARAALGLRLALARVPKPAEIERLAKLYESELSFYKINAEAAAKMATSQLGKPRDNADIAELAAWTVVANVLLNLDEVITKG